MDTRFGIEAQKLNDRATTPDLNVITVGANEHKARGAIAGNIKG
jgi:hypothetical protein